ncbi:MAG: 50S ribosomal protein L5 [Candidatus Yanofskybacteria bacterium]|nr:50S ribosomal protein L5 [Candidatus Yanofskybacteria bacterium]
MPRLQAQYRKNVIPALQKQFGLKNVMAVPKVQKVTVNTGIGRMLKDDKAIEKAERDLALLTGQKPVFRKAKKSIASFKVREGVPVGISVTIRGKRMYDFLDRLISIALPMSKDFRGIDIKNIDTHGNLNLGIKEHSIFPEVTYDTLKDIFGLQVTVTTNAKNREQGIELFRLMGFPIKKA